MTSATPLGEALGIEYRGKHAHALGVVLSDSPLHGAGQADFAYEEKALRAELAGALPSGVFLLGDDEEDDKGKGPSSADEPVYDTAVVYYGYGQGKSVYVGFDLLGQATAAGDGNLFAELIVSGLDYSHPEAVATLPNAVVPVTLTLSNQGMATPGQVTVSLPDGGMIVSAEAGDFQADGSLVWSFGLVETEVRTLDLWVRLPAEAGTVTVDALVQVGTPPDLVDHTSVSLDIAVTEVPALGDVIAIVAALAPEDKEMDKALDALEEADEALLKGDQEKALEELLDAADELADSGHPDAPALRLQVDLLIRDVAALVP